MRYPQSLEVRKVLFPQYIYPELRNLLWYDKRDDAKVVTYTQRVTINDQVVAQDFTVNMKVYANDILSKDIVK